MRSALSCITVCLALVGLGAAAPAHALEISELKAGLACMDTVLEGDDAGWICQPTEEIRVTDQGECVYNGEKKLCTWYGFEFRYSGAGEGATLACTATHSQPVDSGNPKGIVGEDLRKESFELTLAGDSGRYFHPQYTVFRVVEPGVPRRTMALACRDGTRELLALRFVYVYPEVSFPPAD